MQKIEIKKSSHLKSIPESSDLHFGRHFSDHWFHSTFTEGQGWNDSRVEPYAPFLIDPAASVLHYGQALFEGMKAFRQTNGNIALFRPEFNHQRMCEGAVRLCLEPPPKELFLNGLKELITVDSRWVPKEDFCSLYIRPTLIGTEGFLGVRPAKEVKFFIILSPVGFYYSEGSDPIKIWIEDIALRAAPGGLGATKAGANYACSLQAALKAKQRGYAQVLWLDAAKQGIEEVGTMNVFFVFKNEIVTPALNGSILAGGMRDSTIQLLKSMGKNIVERKITIQEVFERHSQGELEESFGTGTAAIISPIGEFFYKDKSYVFGKSSKDSLSQELFKTISGIQQGKLPDRLGWMKSLDQLV